MKYVLKRDERRVTFDAKKITDAIDKAVKGTGFEVPYNEVINIKNSVLDKINAVREEDIISVEEIQNLVVETIRDHHFPDLAKAYDTYRRERTRQREVKSDLMKSISKIGVETDRDNANVGNNFSAKLLRIASEANK
ncbi:MAG: hypothetical protein K2M43_03355 [Mycoplasmoidaceae bacterium]|nr:hypothetical protein [Mycoplasmoidaceae bacterium]